MTKDEFDIVTDSNTKSTIDEILKLYYCTTNVQDNLDKLIRWVEAIEVQADNYNLLAMQIMAWLCRGSGQINVKGNKKKNAYWENRVFIINQFLIHNREIKNERN